MSLSWKGRSRIQFPSVYLEPKKAGSSSCSQREELRVSGAPSYRQLIFARRGSKIAGTSVARPTIHSPNACLPTRHFHLQRQKFWIIWPAIQRRRTRWTASFIGGYSTPASESGRRKFPRPSHNSSREVSSKQSHLRTATYFTVSPRITSRRFSNGHDET